MATASAAILTSCFICCAVAGSSALIEDSCGSLTAPVAISASSLIVRPASRWKNDSARTPGNISSSRGSCTVCTPAQEEKIKEELREWARATDGLYFATVAALKKQNDFDADFYRNFVIRYMKEVLAEPGFQGKKYLGLAAAVGHENTTRIGFALSSNGTATLRESLEAALEARPDLIVIPEWDEQNENTSLRPTVYNGRTTMRLMRYYTARERGELPAPLPDEDVSIANVALSYRKTLTLGEPLKLEYLHIPDQTTKGKPATVTVALVNEAGKTVHTFAPVQLQGGQLAVHTETIPTETLAGSRTLYPVVQVSTEKGERRFEEGFQPIDLRATANWDYKWVMQSLRDLLPVKQCRLSIEPAAGGTESLVQLSAEFAAEEPLAYVEILDNDDVIYSHNPKDPLVRETDSTAVFQVDFQAFAVKKDGLRLKGKLTLSGAAGSWNSEMRFQGKSLILDGERASIWQNRAYLSVPKNQLANATLEVDLLGIWQGTMPLKTVFENGIYGIPGPKGFNLVISRFARLQKMPAHLEEQTARFTIPVLPDFPYSRLHLQAIGRSGKIYRSRPLVVGTPSGERIPVSVYSDTAGKAVYVEVESRRVPVIEYRFTPDKTGSVLTTAAGRPFWGILGGFSNQATGRGGAESRDGTPFLVWEDYPANATTAAPAWEKIDGESYALVFDGKGTYITLPQGAIPRRAGFTLEMEIMPDTVEGKQILLVNRSYYPGSITVYLENGVLKSEYVNVHQKAQRASSGLRVVPHQWNRIKVHYDQRTILLEVNGERSAAFRCVGPGLYETVTSVGGYGNAWFAGKMKSLVIRHGH